jgi:hypothetical protein
METIVKAEVHRLVIIDGEGKVCGVVSLSDILSFLVLRPSGEDKRTKSRPSGPGQSNSEKTTTIKEDATSDSHAFDEKKCEEKPKNANDDEPVNKKQ